MPQDQTTELESNITTLLHEIEQQYYFPEARAALTQLGTPALPTLLAYVKDTRNNLMPREDVAKAIGNMQEDRVVLALKQYLEEAPPNDKAMPIYALGETKNPNAVFVIKKFLEEQTDYDRVALTALNKIGTPEARMVIDNFGLRT